jgi:serine/threonine protein kinase/Tfp pilus assembly protein PilF
LIGKTISHYKVLEKLGGGGMGVVYKAQDTKLDRTVALKFLPEHLLADKEAVQRFISEAKAASSFDHPNICTIHDINKTEDGHFFIVMGYYKGETLKRKLDAGPIQIDTAINYATQIATGLARAHEAGIIHRDIKPENIIITNSDEVKILDFGLAKISGETSITKSGSTVGTVSYLSPEQAKGESVDHITDIWSLGVVLYEMLAGERPFKGEYEQAVMYSILNEEPQKPAGIDEKIWNIIGKAISKDASLRYQSIADLLDDLNKGRIEIIEDKAIRNLENKNTSGAIKSKKMPIVALSIVAIVTILVAAYFIWVKNPSSESALTERKMMVVLPFENLSSSEEDYFADGITEEITSRLSEIKKLGVIGRASANQYKNTDKTIEQIGDELGVDYLLEGTVRWEKTDDAESRVRVTPQLIQVSDGTHLWTKRYDAVLQSVFDVQSDIAEKVAQALNVTLLSTEQKSLTIKPTDNLLAYDYYLQGNNYLVRGYSIENYQIAQRMFEKAVELDPDFVLAYTKLAQVNVDYYWFYWDRTKKRLAKSKGYIEKAQKLNPNLPEVYLALGQYYYHGFLEYDNALAELEKGLELRPDNGKILSYIGFIKRRQGKFEEAIEVLDKSLKLDPLNSHLTYNIGESYTLLRNYDKANHYFDQAMLTIPDWSVPYMFKAKVKLLENGDIEGAYKILKSSLNVVTLERERLIWALSEVQKFLGKYEDAINTLLTENYTALNDQWQFAPKSQLLATIYGLQNKPDLEITFYDSARAVLETKIKELPDDARVFSALGLVLAGLGKKEEAIFNGKRAVELLPIEKEAWRGWHRELDLAKIYTIVGEHELAIQKLDYLLSIPGELSVPYLKIDPVWQPLLDNPNFQNVIRQYE